MPNNVSGSLGGSSFSVQGAQSTFDVSKETEVIALLKLIHQNPFDGAIKNHLRDLIFAYRQDMTKEAYDLLATSCSTLGIQLAPFVLKVDLSKKSPYEVVSSWSRPRPVPSFTTVASVSIAPSEPSAVVSTTVGATETVVQSVPVNEQPVTPKKQTASHAEQPVTVSPASSYQDRIAYIKKEINEKVGNPVQLIEADNVLGREYMNALLDAMKKSNGSTEGEIGNAMATLESAYTRILQKLANSQQTPVHAPVATPTPPSDAREVIPAAVATLTQDAVPEPILPSSEPVSQVRVDELEQKLAALKSKFANVQSRTPLTTHEKTKETEGTEARTIPVRVDSTAQETALPQEPKESERRSEKIQSVAKNKQLEDLMRTKRVAEIENEQVHKKETEAKMDPLYTPEVSHGLDQLLSEWTLFRSSGFFGTGPSGKDHELYHKISGLTMASVVAGRFEGATPLIKQSISDYMNGWRYEEGIVHEHGETFEHYLRKVVHHILSKKKSALGIV